MPRLAGFFLLLASTTFAADSALRAQVTELFRHRQWAEAQAVLERTVAAEPGNAEACFYLGQARIARGDIGGAVLALEQATALAPTRGDYFRWLGDSYGISAQRAGLLAKFGWARKCKAAYDQSVELDPTDVKARWSVMEYCRQASGVIGGSLVGGSMDAAYAQAAEIRKLDPARGRQAFALLYLTDKKYDLALAEFDGVLKGSPDDYGALYQVGRLASSSGRFLDRGLAALRRCLELPVPPNEPGRAPTQWRIGNILEKQGDKAGARVAYQAALQADPEFPPAIEGLQRLN